MSEATRCPFYGKHAAPGFPLVDQGGNQCALIVTAYAPCVMEQLGADVNAATCMILRAAGNARRSALEIRRKLEHA